MSYDLYFTTPRITEGQFTSYFHSRPNCEVQKNQCLYQNEDTGVYFVIDYNKPEEADPEGVDSTASLNLNYFRPHVFGLEAVDFISAFVDHFGFSIHDPQTEGMGEGPFSKDGFLKGWNHGNEFGYAAVLNGDNSPETVWTLPGNQLESVWKWNFEKNAVQESSGEDRFVPRVFFMIVSGRVVSVAVWPDAIPELIPKVDFLYIGREELAPKSILGIRKKDEFLLSFDAIRSDLEPFASDGYSLPAYKLPTPTVPGQLQARIRDLKPTGLMGDAISVDQILNEEIVAKFRRGT